MSEIHPTDRKSITASIFLMKVCVKLIVNPLSLQKIICGLRPGLNSQEFELNKRQDLVHHD